MNDWMARLDLKMNNWMVGLDDNRLIGEVSIPGTHESGATMGIYAKCQNLSISEQLALGIRFLDIRVADDDLNKPLRVTHGSVDQHLKLESVLDDVYDFLKTNPSEFVLMNIQLYFEYAPGSFSRAFNELVAKKEADWFFEPRIPQVKEVRKKIVLIRSYDPEGRENSGWSSERGIPWNGYNTDGESENEFFYTQNRWNQIIGFKKKEWIAQNLAKDTNILKITFNFLSFGNLAIPNIEPNAKTINIFAFDEICKYPLAYRLGVMPMDYAGNKPGLIELIISHNMAQEFDVDFYRATHPDLENAQAALKHWFDHGLPEGQPGSYDFDVKFYLETYPDLKKNYGKNYRAALDHWVYFGRSEGRQGAPSTNRRPSVADCT